MKESQWSIDIVIVSLILVTEIMTGPFIIWPNQALSIRLLQGRSIYPARKGIRGNTLTQYIYVYGCYKCWFVARVEDRNKYKGDICCSQCYFYLVCVSPGKVLYLGGCGVGRLAGLRRMFLFYVSHSVQTNTIKVGVAVTQHRIAPHLANKMIPPETSHVFIRIILIRAVWDEMLNPFYISIAPFVLFIALTQPDPQSRNRISKCRYANILQESTQMNAILTTKNTQRTIALT